MRAPPPNSSFLAPVAERSRSKPAQSRTKLPHRFDFATQNLRGQRGTAKHLGKSLDFPNPCGKHRSRAWGARNESPSPNSSFQSPVAGQSRSQAATRSGVQGNSLPLGARKLVQDSLNRLGNGGILVPAGDVLQWRNRGWRHIHYLLTKYCLHSAIFTLFLHI